MLSKSSDLLVGIHNLSVWKIKNSLPFVIRVQKCTISVHDNIKGQNKLEEACN